MTQIQVFDLRRLRRSFMGISGLFMLGTPLMLLANIVLARTLTVAEFGVFGFAMSLMTLWALPVSGGFAMLLTREVAGYVRNGDWPAYRALITASYGWVITVSAVLGLGVFGWTHLAEVTIPPVYLIAMFAVPFLGLNGIRSGILKGLGNPALAEGPTQILQPVLMIVGYTALAAMGLASVTLALAWHLIVLATVFCIASVLLWRVQPHDARGAGLDFSGLAHWGRSVIPFMMMNAITVLSYQIAVLVLGSAGMEEAVAQMRVAERGAQLITFPLLIMNTILGPHFVSATQRNSAGDLRNLAKQAARMTFLVAGIGFVILLVFGRFLLQITFGESYEDSAYDPMIVMSLANLILVGLGSSGLLLAMGGHETIVLLSQAAVVVITFVTCLLLIEPYGVVGAALGVGLGTTSGAILLLYFVRRHYSISPAIL